MSQSQTDSQPDISVIVATYNQESTIARTLESILEQDFAGRYEIVIGDDGSTDGTRSVCESYAARYPEKIRYIHRDVNMGVCRNYFDCISRCRGRYLADCAGDDFWVDRHKLSRQIAELERNPRVAMVTTDWLCCDPTGGRVRRHHGRPEVTERVEYRRGELCAPILAQHVTLHLCSALYRRDLLLQAMKGNEHIYVDGSFSCEDQQILLAMASAGNVVTLPGVSLHYSVGHDSISHRIDWREKFDYSLQSLRQMLIWQRHFGVADSAMGERYRRQMDYLASIAFRLGEPQRRARLKSFMAQTGLRPGARGELYMKTMHIEPLWWLLRQVKR